jgi:hypothetical protein
VPSAEGASGKGSANMISRPSSGCALAERPVNKRAQDTDQAKSIEDDLKNGEMGSEHIFNLVSKFVFSKYMSALTNKLARDCHAIDSVNHFCFGSPPILWDSYQREL